MNQCLTCLTNSPAQAAEIANHLRVAGFPANEISLVQCRLPASEELPASVTEWLVDYGEFALPAMGRVAAGGPIRALLDRGGLTEALKAWGLPTLVASRYETRVKDGSEFLAVSCTNVAVAQLAKVVCDNFRAEDVYTFALPRGGDP